jgi:hypothetical protein
MLVAVFDPLQKLQLGASCRSRFPGATWDVHRGLTIRSGGCRCAGRGCLSNSVRGLADLQDLVLVSEKIAAISLSYTTWVTLTLVGYLLLGGAAMLGVGCAVMRWRTASLCAAH